MREGSGGKKERDMDKRRERKGGERERDVKGRREGEEERWRRRMRD